MHTTLIEIRAYHPCVERWETLLRFLGKTRPDEKPLSLKTILKSNGLDDAVWCLRAVDGYDREKSLFAIKCVRRVQHLLKDQRSVNALDVAEAYANGLVSAEELRKAREEAWVAMWAASGAERMAGEAVWAAAKGISWASEGFSWASEGISWASEGARIAARMDALASAAEEAAALAIGATARVAAAATAGVAMAVAEAAWAAWAAERDFQTNLFIEMFSSTQEEK